LFVEFHIVLFLAYFETTVLGSVYLPHTIN